MNITENTTLAQTKDSTFVREVFSKFPSGVVAIAAEVHQEKHVLVASSFMVGVSLEPCLVAVAIQKTSSTWPTLRQSSELGISILGSGQSQLTRQLAGRDRSRRFQEVSVDATESGAVLLHGSAVWFTGQIYEETDAGDHWMVLLEVKQLGASTTSPLVWHDGDLSDLPLEK